MIYFFKEKKILYPFSYFTQDKYLDKDYIEEHKLVSSLLFFQRDYKKDLLFKKEIYKKDDIIINLYQYKNIFLIEKKHDYISNEYFIGIYTINLLRSIIPTFTYTYFKLSKKLWLEYNSGNTFYSYLKNFEHKKIDDIIIQEEGNNYLSIFFQIISSLEVSQEQCLFTHYDLHLENIMINKNVLKKDLLFPIGYNNYSFISPKYIISILDYEYSCSRYKDKIINTLKPFLFNYGYFSIFFSGVDILRVLFSFYYNFYSLQNNLFIEKIYSFHNFIFKNFYKIPIEKLDYKSLQYHSTYFFNLTFSKKIYKTPYELLLFLKNNESYISSIFLNKSFPFVIKKKDNFITPIYIQPKNSLSLTDFLKIEPKYYTIYKNKKELYLQYKKLKEYKENFEYFYFLGLIPCNSLILSIQIYRYLHSIEQILLLVSIYPPTEYIYFELNIFKLPYLYKN